MTVSTGQFIVVEQEHPGAHGLGDGAEVRQLVRTALAGAETPSGTGTERLLILRD